MNTDQAIAALKNRDQFTNETELANILTALGVRGLPTADVALPGGKRAWSREAVSGYCRTAERCRPSGGLSVRSAVATPEPEDDGELRAALTGNLSEAVTKLTMAQFGLQRVRVAQQQLVERADEDGTVAALHPAWPRLAFAADAYASEVEDAETQMERAAELLGACG